MCFSPYDVQRCYSIQHSVISPVTQCVCVFELKAPFCARAAIWKLKMEAERSAVLIERQRCTVIIMKALQGK